jgi:hypothetical protein
MRLPLVLSLKRSRTLLVALASAHGLVLVALLLVATDWTPAVLEAGLLVVSAIWTLRHHGLGLGEDQIVALGIKRDGTIDIYRAHGDAIPAMVDSTTSVFPWMVVLRLRTADKRLTLSLPVDALGTEEHRQLRLWLSWLAKP